MRTNKYYCHTHPTSYIGLDQHQNPYKNCWAGKQLYDKGEIVKCDIRDASEDTNGKNP